MQRAVLLTAQDTPFQWVTTSVEEATDFTIHMEKSGWVMNSDTEMLWPENTRILPVYISIDLIKKVIYFKEQAIFESVKKPIFI
jgi:hypothetical protein